MDHFMYTVTRSDVDDHVSVGHYSGLGIAARCGGVSVDPDLLSFFHLSFLHQSINLTKWQLANVLNSILQEVLPWKSFMLIDGLMFGVKAMVILTLLEVICYFKIDIKFSKVSFFSFPRALFTDNPSFHWLVWLRIGFLKNIPDDFMKKRNYIECFSR